MSRIQVVSGTMFHTVHDLVGASLPPALRRPSTDHLEPCKGGGLDRLCSCIHRSHGHSPLRFDDLTLIEPDQRIAARRGGVTGIDYSLIAHRDDPALDAGSTGHPERALD